MDHFVTRIVQVVAMGVCVIARMGSAQYLVIFNCMALFATSHAMAIVMAAGVIRTPVNVPLPVRTDTGEKTAQMCVRQRVHHKIPDVLKERVNAMTATMDLLVITVPRNARTLTVRAVLRTQKTEIQIDVGFVSLAFMEKIVSLTVLRTAMVDIVLNPMEVVHVVMAGLEVVARSNVFLIARDAMKTPHARDV